MRSENVVSLPETYQGTCEHHGEFTGTLSVIIGKAFRTGCPACTEIRKAKEISTLLFAYRFDTKERAAVFLFALSSHWKILHA